MLRSLLVLLALGSVLLGLLTVVKSPDWAPWRLALLAGEFGYCVAAVPLLVVAAAWCTRGSHPVSAGIAAVLSLLAIVLLLKPVAQAWSIGRTLPGNWHAISVAG